MFAFCITTCLGPHETRCLAGHLQLYLLERGHSYTRTCSKSLQLVGLAQRNGMKNILYKIKWSPCRFCPCRAYCSVASNNRGSWISSSDSNERKASSSHKLLLINENAILYVAVLKYLTMPRLILRNGTLPISDSSSQSLPESQDPLATSLGSNLPAVKSSAKSSPSSDSVEISRLYRFVVYFLRSLPVFCVSTAVTIDPQQLYVPCQM
jgi:hypothetical protein